jgi:PIN domain nuclease of toxin-antitoxin system
MKVLLDTHILLPIIEGRSKSLGPAARRVLESPDAEIYVSVATLWEIAIKWRLKKLDLSRPPDTLPPLISAIGIGLIHINVDHVLVSVEPEPATRDPFDRLLLAQCQVEGMRLLTTDRALVDHPLAATR